jgi:D-lactate dehydrogenase
MRVAVFSAKHYDKEFFEQANADFGYDLVFFEAHLNHTTASIAKGFEAVCVFVNDLVDEAVLRTLSEGGVKIIALRCAGFNNVDLKCAQLLGMPVVRVPAYSPHSVAEHTLALILTLNRQIHRAHNRVREGNFALDGLLGFDLHGLTVGVIGTGKIGFEFAKIMNGLGCRVLAHDINPHPQSALANINYVSLDTLLHTSDIISLHCPLTPQTHHLINRTALSAMKDGVMLINTSRGALIDTNEVITALKSGKVDYLGLDVYEEESDLFFEDLSNWVLQDDVFARLLTFPNVLITGHQAFFTRNAMSAIAHTTLANLSQWRASGQCANSVNAS